MSLVSRKPCRFVCHFRWDLAASSASHWQGRAVVGRDFASLVSVLTRSFLSLFLSSSLVPRLFPCSPSYVRSPPDAKKGRRKKKGEPGDESLPFYVHSRKHHTFFTHVTFFFLLVRLFPWLSSLCLAILPRPLLVLSPPAVGCLSQSPFRVPPLPPILKLSFSFYKRNTLFFKLLRQDCSLVCLCWSKCLVPVSTAILCCGFCIWGCCFWLFVCGSCLFLPCVLVLGIAVCVV